MKSQRHPSHEEMDGRTEVASSGAFARHYTVAEIAAMWNLSKDTVRRIFQNEPGVLVLGGRSQGHKRCYTTLRIPQSVLERVYRQYSLYYK